MWEVQEWNIINIWKFNWLLYFYQSLTISVMQYFKIVVKLRNFWNKRLRKYATFCSYNVKKVFVQIKFTFMKVIFNIVSTHKFTKWKKNFLLVCKIYKNCIFHFGSSLVSFLLRSSFSFLKSNKKCWGRDRELQSLKNFES